MGLGTRQYKSLGARSTRVFYSSISLRYFPRQRRPGVSDCTESYSTVSLLRQAPVILARPFGPVVCDRLLPPSTSSVTSAFRKLPHELFGSAFVVLPRASSMAPSFSSSLPRSNTAESTLNREEPRRNSASTDSVVGESVLLCLDTVVCRATTSPRVSRPKGGL